MNKSNEDLLLIVYEALELAEQHLEILKDIVEARDNFDSDPDKFWEIINSLKL